MKITAGWVVVQAPPVAIEFTQDEVNKLRRIAARYPDVADVVVGDENSPEYHDMMVFLREFSDVLVPR